MRRAGRADPDGRAADELRASTLARRYLRFGVRSVAQVRTHLQAHGVPLSVIGTVLADCKHRGWVDDRACAKLLAGRLAEQGYAAVAIRARLEAIRLVPDVVEAALAPWRSAAAELARAREAAERQRRRPRALGEPVRVARWLARRGFSPETIEQVVTLHE